MSAGQEIPTAAKRIFACFCVLAVGGCVEAPPPPLPIAVVPPPAAASVNAPARPECREFHQTIMIGGVAKEGYGTTCRQPDGTWRIESGPPGVPLPAYRSP